MPGKLRKCIKFQFYTAQFWMQSLMQFLKYKKLNTTLQQHHPHIQRNVTSTPLDPIDKATHFLIFRAQKFNYEAQQSGVPLFSLCQDGGDRAFFCKVVFNFSYF